MIKKIIIILILVLVFTSSLCAADNIFTDDVGIGVSSADAKLHVEGGNILQEISSNPAIVGSVYNATNLNGACSVAVSGKYAYVPTYNSAYLNVIDISDPALPVLEGSVYDATNLNGGYTLAVAGKYVYVASYSTDRLTVVDVSNANSPSVVGSVYDATYLNTATKVFISGQYAYVTTNQTDRLTVVDISDPTSPSVAGSVYNATQLNQTKGLYVQGDYAYVAAVSADRLAVVDISDPTSPSIVTSLYDGTNFNGINDIYVSGRYLYLTAYYGSRLTVVDISDPDSPSVVGSVQDTTNLFGAYGLYVSGKYAYATSYSNDRVTIIDVSDPTSPSVVGSITDTQLDAPYSIYVSGKYAYVACLDADRLTIVDLFGIDASSANIGDISASSINVGEDMDIGQGLYVRSGVNVGIGGIKTDGELSCGDESKLMDKVGINISDPPYDLSIDGTLGIIEGGSSPEYYTVFQAPDLASSYSLVLPVDDGSSGQGLLTNGSGALTWEDADLPTGASGQTLYYNGGWVGSSLLFNNATNVGIGDTTPASLLTVGSGDLFQVNSFGAIAAAAGIVSSGAITFSGLTTDGSVTVSSGALSSEAQLATARGGTGANFGSTAQGNTLYFSGAGAISALAPGTSGQFLQTQGASANPQWATYSNTTGPTLVIAASGSNSTVQADYVCNGTNDEATIESAIAALPSGGGRIKLLEGTYTIQAAIDITKSNVWLTGSGKSTILQRSWDAATSSGVITVGDGGTTTVSGIVIEDLAINGQKATYIGIQNLGIYFNQDVTYSKIQGNWIYGCDGCGIELAGASGETNTYNLITGNYVDNNDYGGIKLDYSDYNVVSDNMFDGNIGWPDICVNTSSTNNAVARNTCTNNTVCGISLGSTAYANSVTGNNLEGNEVGIDFYGADYNVASNNVISNSNDYGVRIRSAAQYNVISGNVIYESIDDSMSIDGDSDSNLISSNSIYDSAGSTYAININSSDCDNNYLIANYYSGTGASSINDSGTGTAIQHWNEFDIQGTLKADRFVVEEADSGITLTTDDFGKTISVDSSSSQTVTLPSVDSTNLGAWVRVLKLNSGQVTVDAADSDTIADSTAGGTIYNNQSGQDYAVIEIQLANGTEWVVVHAEGTWSTN